MGQFGNQPDFITNDIKIVFNSNNINRGTYLNGSVIYIGGAGDMVAIPAGAVGESVISGFSSPGYAGSNGTLYSNNAANVATTGGSGTGLTVDYVADKGVIQTIVVNTAGALYLNGDLITIDNVNGPNNAVFRIVAAPGPPTEKEGIFFKGLQTGGFLPVTVDYVLASRQGGSEVTTVTDLVAGK